ncbi:hypothetical protein C8R34_103108 [Nitrosomonas sp. Nm84]|uniref:hypothetical protein n=1 Tax=Nitrosomonas sp. Nm84 TaxID=200124 RepID=UPI000D757CCF|nr:hypothetical protein [Nitrosomonas sp. Nm84]PXW89951.1 hypothetical protein C8R34_103108 [Nitrosomonas sp. Nm84]
MTRHLDDLMMAAYLETCLEEANGDAAFIAKASRDVMYYAKSVSQIAHDASIPIHLTHNKLIALNCQTQA